MLKSLLNQKSGIKKIDIYKEDILEWISDFRNMLAAQVLDWLKEKCVDVKFRRGFKALY